SRRTFERLVQDIREGQLTSERIKEVRAFLSETETVLEKQKKELEGEELAQIEKESPSPEEGMAVFKEGIEVQVEPGNRRGTVVRSAGKKKWVVALGSVKMTVEENRMRLVKKTSSAKLKIEFSTSYGDSGQAPVFSL